MLSLHGDAMAVKTPERCGGTPLSLSSSSDSTQAIGTTSAATRTGLRRRRLEWARRPRQKCPPNDLRHPAAFQRLRAISLTVLRLLGLRAGLLAIGAITVWIVRRPSLPARSQALAAGAIGSALCAAASNPRILGTIVSAAAHSPTRCRIASAPARNQRHVAKDCEQCCSQP